MADYAMRQTLCTCGHIAVEHYDSHDFCTWTLDGKCNCEKFVACGPEISVTWSDSPAAALSEREETSE